LGFALPATNANAKKDSQKPLQEIPRAGHATNVKATPNLKMAPNASKMMTALAENAKSIGMMVLKRKEGMRAAMQTGNRMVAQGAS
jgi:hypothetical protein